jgi:hypothetical protein
MKNAQNNVGCIVLWAPPLPAEFTLTPVPAEDVSLLPESAGAKPAED